MELEAERVARPHQGRSRGSGMCPDKQFCLTNALLAQFIVKNFTLMSYLVL